MYELIEFFKWLRKSHRTMQVTIYFNHITNWQNHWFVHTMIVISLPVIFPIYFKCNTQTANLQIEKKINKKSRNHCSLIVRLNNNKSFDFSLIWSTCKHCERTTNTKAQRFSIEFRFFFLRWNKPKDEKKDKKNHPKYAPFFHFEPRHVTTTFESTFGIEATHTHTQTSTLLMR